MDKLLIMAAKAWNVMPQDERIHERHQQRISFVVGNMALSSSMSKSDIRQRVQAAAGPCPCHGCGYDRWADDGGR